MNKWDRRFMELTETVANWSSCFQDNRHVGAVIVMDKRVLTTGYNGAPAGIQSCADRGECLRRKLNIASGTMQEICYAVHAEQNAIIQAARRAVSRRRRRSARLTAVSPKGPFIMPSSSPSAMLSMRVAATSGGKSWISSRCAERNARTAS